MSWSLNLIGKPEKVIAKLEEFGTKLDRTTNAEYQKAKIHLIELVRLNGNDTGDMLVQVDAWGSQSTSDGVITGSSMTVNVKPIYGVLL